MTGCPCGSGRPLAACCGPLLAGGREAATAEELMRSRYTAFAVGDEGYLLRSWHPAHRPAAVALDPGDRWTGLTVVATAGGGVLDAEGVVEFVATFERGGRPGAVRERSRFARSDGRWVYVDAE